jgi:hypothetical protein
MSVNQKRLALGQSDAIDRHETWANLELRWSVAEAISAWLDLGKDRRSSAPRGAQIHITKIFGINLLDP